MLIEGNDMKTKFIKSLWKSQSFNFVIESYWYIYIIKNVLRMRFIGQEQTIQFREIVAFSKKKAEQNK